jgi:hypothetical protein
MTMITTYPGPPAACARITPDDANRWLLTARRRDVRVYHVGDLAFDRTPHGHTAEARNDDKARAEAVKEVGCIMHEASAAGIVALTQRRVDRFVFEYLATFLKDA